MSVALDNLPNFPGLDGIAMTSGYVYIGVANQDPQTFPVAVFWDSALSVPATQPLRTIGGYIANAGAPANVYTAGQYSLKVLDASGVQVFYAAQNPGDVQTSNFMAGIAGSTTAAAVRTALGFTAPVIDRAYGEYLLNANLSTVIPGDDTIPQNTEGTQIISLSFTPKATTSRLRLRFQGQGTSDTAATGVIAAIFSSASANALSAVNSTVHVAGYFVPLVTEIEYVPGVTTALTFSVRVGPAAAANMRMNGNQGSRFFGGTSRATLVIEEIAV